MPNKVGGWLPPLIREPPFYHGQLGVPGTDSDRGLRTDSNGIVLYVDPNHVDANDNRDGTNPDSPLATVSAAISKCRAYRNDVIAVAPNSYWTYGNTAVGRATPIREEVTINVPGVRLIGLSNGSMGVYWEPTSNDGVCITVDAMDVTIEGFAFWSYTYTGGIGVLAEWDGPPYGENVVVRNCLFEHDLDYGIQLDYSWYAEIYDNWFVNIGLAAIYNLDNYGDPDYALIYRNHFVDCTAAVSLQDCEYCHVYSNWINGDPTSAGSYIDFAGGGANVAADNWLASTLAQYAGAGGNCADGVADHFLNNHCVDGDTVANP